MKKIAFFLLFASPLVAQTKADLSGAANLFDLTFTTQELDTLYSDVVDNLANYKAMHALSLNNNVPLSLWQSPKLPGMKFDLTQRPVVWPVVRAKLPTQHSDLAFYSIDQLAHLIKTKQISSVDLNNPTFLIEKFGSSSTTITSPMVPIMLNKRLNCSTLLRLFTST